MAIDITRYVNIVSGVGGGASVRQRDFSALVFSTDERVPAQSVMTFTSADEVERYFRGAASKLPRLASDYFGYVSPNISSPERLFVARWVGFTDSEAWVRGASPSASLAQIKALTAGQLLVTVTSPEGVATFSPVVSAAVSLSDVAAAFQTAMRAAVPAWTTTMSAEYSAVEGRFIVEAGSDSLLSFGFSGPGTLDVLMGLRDGVASPFQAVQSPAEAFSDLIDRTNNFGGFMYDSITPVTVEQAVDVAALNHARNVEFMFSVGWTDMSDAEAFFAAARDLSGTWSQHSPSPVLSYPIAPLAILAATDFDSRQGVINYMFRDFSFPATVSTNAEADEADAVRLNYMGQTQTAGQTLKFLQRGVLMGSATAPVDANVYANEMWLKDAARAALMGLLLSVSRVPANDDGRGMVRAILQDAVIRALNNGTISPGKTLSIQQKLYITQLTGDPRAHFQVANDGYWADVQMESYVTTDSRTEWRATYTLIYSKDDAIRRIDGRHVLI